MIGNYQKDHHPLSSSLLAVLVYQISEVQLLSTWRFSVLILPLVLLVKTLQSVFDIISNLNPLPRELHGMKYATMLQMGPGGRFSKGPETFRARKAIAKSQTLRLPIVVKLKNSKDEGRFPSYKKFQAYTHLRFQIQMI